MTRDASPPNPGDSPAGSRTSSLYFIQSRLRRLSSLSPPKSSASNGDARGPIGLNLLHEPSEPRIDFVFIHGLNGGSRKTWSHSPEPAMFWPKEWLPNEAGFRHVRLHSFGYNSEWTSRKESRLTVHDFGQALLADLHNSPHLRRTSDTPIILVAHSMGGLVAKKAYLLATRDPTYEAISRRIHTMFFLGTPHRGADSAQMAKLLISSASMGAKAFVDDLLPGSGTLDQINDEFRHVCDSLNLWSFFESVPTDFGVKTSLVVDKDSAILGLPREHTQYLQADHRHICKFESPIEPNYITLIRSFVSTIGDIEADGNFQMRESHKAQMKAISSLLGVDQRPDADLLVINEKQHHGSCQWLTTDSAFQDWLTGDTTRTFTDPFSAELENHTPRLFWLNGRPGTGKSVASGHVIKYMEACNLDCSFYFFKHNDKTRSNLSNLLLSLVFQMAQQTLEVRNLLEVMISDEETINTDDYHAIWTKMFVNRIFKIDTFRTQYWVIDAMDECATRDLAPMLSLFGNLNAKLPIRIMFTSRPGGQIERLLNKQQTRFVELHTGNKGSLADIELFIKARCSQSPDNSSYQDLIARILSKSNGIFLWASLTVNRLEETYSLEDMQEVLGQIPSEMNELYRRIITSVTQSPSFEIVKCILKWVVCSPTPLSFSEVQEAVRLDLGRTLTTTPAQLEAMCGHLVSVDKQSRVFVTHQTLSTFLTHERMEFWIDRPLAHAQIADICLGILCGKDLAPPRTKRIDHQKTPDTPLFNYARANFAFHILHCSASVDSSLQLLCKFILSNSPTWIERTAARGDLYTLRQTALRLKVYLSRLAKYHSPLSPEIQTIEGWSTDLTHIVAAFGHNLLTSPSSIHFLIPYLCPNRSLTKKTFIKSSKKLRITGATKDDWDDRLTCYMFADTASAIVCCDKFIAVGVAGMIHVYNSTTFNLVATMNHGKKLRLLAFDRMSSVLASCSARKLTLWKAGRAPEKSWTSLWSRSINFTASSIAFSADDASQLIVSDAQGCALSWHHISNGDQLNVSTLRSLPDSESSDDGDFGSARWIPSEKIRLDPSQKLAAVSYRNASVSIWDIDLPEKLGDFEREGFEDVYSTPQALDMIFNPIPEVELLAISYKDGNLITCNPWNMDQIGHYQLQASLSVLAATSDGRILAGGDEDGAVYLFLFETLQPIYRIERPETQMRIQDLVFSTDNLRFLDIRGQCCNVWEPFILVPKEGSDDSSSEPFSEALTLRETPGTSAYSFQWGESVTSLVHTANGEYLFAGRQDGAIDICDASTGNILNQLRIHDHFSDITTMDWNDQMNLLLSVEINGRCILSKVTFPGRGERAHAKVLTDHREHTTVRNAIISADGLSFLVITDTQAKLIALDSSIRGATSPSSVAPLYLGQLTAESLWALVDVKGVQLLDCQTLEVGTTCPLIRNKQGEESQWILKKDSNMLLIITRKPRGTVLAAFDWAAVLESKTKSESPSHVVNLPALKCVIGMLKSFLYFMDSSGWVCSVNLKNMATIKTYSRHFFVPLTWHTGASPIMTVISKTTVAFARGEDVVLFHGFLDFEEKVTLGV